MLSLTLEIDANVYVHIASNDIYEDDSVDPVHRANARLFDCAIQENCYG